MGKAPALGGGTVSGSQAADRGWNRRKQSKRLLRVLRCVMLLLAGMMWAPMPESYKYSGDNELAPIPEESNDQRQVTGKRPGIKGAFPAVSLDPQHVKRMKPPAMPQAIPEEGRGT